MKKILITGANSFIGTSFEKYIFENFVDSYVIDTLDMQNESWESADFSLYDVVFHVAGIAHSDTGKADKSVVDLYYKVNTELAVNTAKKAKAEGVKQFIFMSSAIVYGESSAVGKSKIITAQTKPAPANYYGNSKLQAEIGLSSLSDKEFKVVILRPPMIYGKGCKGNYSTLVMFAKKLPVFPYVDNVRSMLYIDNLCEFIRLMIENSESGIFHPQNSTYTNTSNMVKIIAEVYGKKIILVKGFTWALKFLSLFTDLVNKGFGSLAYDMRLSEYKDPYIVVDDLKESIANTEI